MAWSGNVRILRIKLKKKKKRSICELWLNLVVCASYYMARQR